MYASPHGGRCRGHETADGYSRHTKQGGIMRTWFLLALVTLFLAGCAQQPTQTGAPVEDRAPAGAPGTPGATTSPTTPPGVTGTPTPGAGPSVLRDPRN